jgi:hypothetical protein
MNGNTYRSGALLLTLLPKWQTPFAGVEAPLFDVARDGCLSANLASS